MHLLRWHSDAGFESAFCIAGAKLRCLESPELCECCSRFWVCWWLRRFPVCRQCFAQSESCFRVRQCRPISVPYIHPAVCLLLSAVAVYSESPVYNQAATWKVLPPVLRSMRQRAFSLSWVRWPFALDFALSFPVVRRSQISNWAFRIGDAVFWRKGACPVFPCTLCGDRQDIFEYQ